MTGDADAVVWFNGPSRDPLLSIPKRSVELGCNWIERDRGVDHVCCFDREMQRLIDVRPATTYWTSHNSYDIAGWRRVDRLAGDQPHNSGTLAVVVALHHLRAERVFIIGCDWGVSTDSVYRYDHPGHQGARKHTLSQVRLLERLAEHRDIRLVADSDRAVDLPRLSRDQFISLWT